MSAKFPGLPGQDFAEYGLNRAANFIALQGQASHVPSAKVLGSQLTAAQTLSPVYIGPRRFNTVEITGTFSATVNILGKVPGSNTFSALTPTAVLSGTASGANITVPGIYSFEGLLDTLQVAVTAYTSGTIENIRVVSA